MLYCMVFLLSGCHLVSSSFLPKQFTKLLPQSELLETEVHLLSDHQSSEMPNSLAQRPHVTILKNLLKVLEENRKIQQAGQEDTSHKHLFGEKNLKLLNRVIRSNNETSAEEMDVFATMDEDDILGADFGKTNRLSVEGSPPQGSGDESLIGTTSDYVLIAMIVAMMFCMTLCCLCLFCRSSSRLSICGINFELNDRRNSLNAAEDLSEIHEVVPLTPTTADNNRLPDIESILRADAPPPLYEDIVEKNPKKEKLGRKPAVSLLDETKKVTTQGQIAKENEAKESSKSFKKKPRMSTQISIDRSSETSSTGGRTSWKIPGRGILASFRAKSSMMRHRKSDSALARHNVEEGGPLPHNNGDQMSSTLPHRVEGDVITMETVEEVVKETEEEKEAKRDKVFVYDVSELPDDDDVFL